MSCSVSSTQSLFVVYVEWFYWQDYGRDCGAQHGAYIDYWETYDADGHVVQRVDNAWASGCAYPPDPTWKAQAEAFMAPIISAARANLIAGVVASLGPNQRLRDVTLEHAEAGPTGRITMTERLRCWVDTFTCPDGEEPPSWGQPPYDEPGAPGSCEYATSLACGGANETWLALVVDSLGNPSITDCAFDTFDYCHAPCDATFGPPAKSVRVPPPAGQAERDAAYRSLVETHIPDAASRMTGAGCAWPPPGWAEPRIRSSISEDAGSLFQATQAVAVELGISEAFPYGSDVPAGVLRAFREALTPAEVASRYYPLPTRNQEMLVTVDGETNLGRMARVYPEALMLPATSIPGESGGLVTAQQAIQHVLNSWESAHPWLVFEPVPDLRILEPGAVSDPRQYYIDNAAAGVLTTAAVVIPQDGTDRRSMRDILDEWLSIFPGTIVRQTSSGTIELVPRVGPDAPEDPAVTLTWRDLIAISEGDPDPRGVINRARVTSQGWEFTDNQTLRPPAFVVSIGGLGIERSVLDGEEVIPDDSEEFQPWHTIPFTVLVDGGNSVTVNVSITAFGSWSRTTASAFSTEGTASPSVTLAVGQSAEVSITHTSRALSVTARWRLTRVSSVAIGVEPVSVPSYAENPLGRTYLAYLLEFDIIGTAWVRSNESVTSEFGQDGVGIPADGGGDAIANSRAQYGERLAQLQSNTFQLTPEQAQAIAQSYVLWNINPRTIRDVQQSEWNRYPVKFDHIGRYVELPTGEVAVVENRSYSDAFAPGGGMMQSAFTATVTETVIDTSTDWLLLDSGDFMQLDSGTLLEVS